MHDAGGTGSILGREDPLEEDMAIHSSILAWKTPWREAPGELQSWGHKELDTTKHAPQERSVGIRRGRKARWPGQSPRLRHVDERPHRAIFRGP